MTNSSMCKYSMGIALSCFIGLILSIYSMYVELKKEDDETFEAMCDISEHMSCSKVFTSRYGRGFGIIGQIFGEDSILNQPNGLSGIIFYISIALITFSKKFEVSILQLVLCATSNFLSIYLGYILYYVLEDLCVVCVSMYILNMVILVLTINRHHLILQDRLHLNYKKIN